MIKNKQGATILTGVSIILLIAFVLLTTSSLIANLEENYIDTNISQAEPVNTSILQAGVSAEEINATFAPIGESFENYGEASGFIDIFKTGFIVVLSSFISLVRIVPQMMSWGNEFIGLFASAFFIPIELVYFGMVMVMLWFIFKFIEVKRSNQGLA